MNVSTEPALESARANKKIFCTHITHTHAHLFIIVVRELIYVLRHIQSYSDSIPELVFKVCGAQTGNCGQGDGVSTNFMAIFILFYLFSQMSVPLYPHDCIHLGLPLLELNA